MTSPGCIWTLAKILHLAADAGVESDAALPPPQGVAAAAADALSAAAQSSPEAVQSAAAAAASAAASVASHAAGSSAPSLTVSLFLILVAAIFLIGVLGEIVFEKTGIPDVVWLILVGIFVGPVSGLASREVLAQVAPYFGALTLIIVLFNGGSELKLGELKQAAARASILALLTFLFSAVALMLLSMGAKSMGWLPAEWTWMHGVCLGCILGGSSSIVVMPALKKAKLNAELTNLTNLESALTDSFCVVGVGAAIQIMLTGSGDLVAAAQALGKSFGIGIAVGGVAGILGILILRRLSKSEHAYPLTLGALIVLYVIVDGLEGSAALAILTTAIMLGNAKAFSRKIGLAKDAFLDQGIKDVHGQVAFFIKSFFFTFIGAMIGAPWGLVSLGIVLGVMLLAVRIPAVFLATAGSTLDMDSRKIASVFLPRGMAAGVLAMMPNAMGVPGTKELPVLVFAAIVTTIILFSAGFPLLKLMIARRVQAEASVQNAAAQQAERLEAVVGPDILHQKAAADAGTEAGHEGESAPRDGEAESSKEAPSANDNGDHGEAPPTEPAAASASEVSAPASGEAPETPAADSAQKDESESKPAAQAEEHSEPGA